MNESNDIMRCTLLHLYDLVERRISEYWTTEENMNTIQGKYWNICCINKKRTNQEEVDKIKLAFLVHCFLKHGVIDND